MNFVGRIYPQREMVRLFEERGSGEIGRRTGFRFQRSKGRVGSSPTFRTKSKKTRKLASLFLFFGAKGSFASRSRQASD